MGTQRYELFGLRKVFLRGNKLFSIKQKCTNAIRIILLAFQLFTRDDDEPLITKIGRVRDILGQYLYIFHIANLFIVLFIENKTKTVRVCRYVVLYFWHLQQLLYDSDDDDDVGGAVDGDGLRATWV